MTFEITVILLLVIANGLFSGAEIAILTLRKSRLEELAEGGSRFARAVARLRKKPERFLATVQIGITVVGATAAAFGGSTLAARIEPWIARLTGETYSGELAIGTVVVLVSYLSLVIGELVPKSLALRHPEGYARATAAALEGLAHLARPMVWLLTASSNLILRGFGDHTSFSESRLSAQELRQLVEEAAEAGTLHPRAGEIASRAIDFAELYVSEVMVPRRAVTSVPVDEDPEDLLRLLLGTRHARLPVYEGTRDNVIGYIPTQDALARVAQDEDLRVRDLLRPAFFIPDTARAVDLLHELQQRRIDLAMVVDETGGFAGIVTVEDLLEELVGELFDEHDPVPPPPIVRQSDGTLLVLGTAPVREVNRDADLQLPEGDWVTVAGLCLSLAGNIPKPGDRLATEDGTVLEIVDASVRRVRKVRIHPAPARAGVEG